MEMFNISSAVSVNIIVNCPAPAVKVDVEKGWRDGENRQTRHYHSNVTVINDVSPTIRHPCQPAGSIMENENILKF